MTSTLIAFPLAGLGMVSSLLLVLVIIWFQDLYQPRSSNGHIFFIAFSCYDHQPKKKESKIFSRAFFQIFDLKYNVSRFILVFWYRVYHNNQLLWFACIHQPQIQFSNFPRIQASLDLKCSKFAWSSSIHSLICCVCYCQVHPPGERVVRKFPDPAHLHHALHLPLLGQGPALQV